MGQLVAGYGALFNGNDNLPYFVPVLGSSAALAGTGRPGCPAVCLHRVPAVPSPPQERTFPCCQRKRCRPDRARGPRMASPLSQRSPANHDYKCFTPPVRAKQSRRRRQIRPRRNEGGPRDPSARNHRDHGHERSEYHDPHLFSAQGPGCSAQHRRFWDRPFVPESTPQSPRGRAEDRSFLHSRNRASWRKPRNCAPHRYARASYGSEGSCRGHRNAQPAHFPRTVRLRIWPGISLLPARGSRRARKTSRIRILRSCRVHREGPSLAIPCELNASVMRSIVPRYLASPTRTPTTFLTVHFCRVTPSPGEQHYPRERFAAHTAAAGDHESNSFLWTLRLSYRLL